MPQAVDSIVSALDQLSQKIESLEERIVVLERQQRDVLPLDSPMPGLDLQRPRAPETWRGFPPLETPLGAVPILGKAVLGIAGAYLLRALAESSSIPKLPVLFIAIAYSYCWLIWAARVHKASQFASATYGVTSALILSPLLWESAVRFQVLSAAWAAIALVGFVALSLGLAWQPKLQVTPLQVISSQAIPLQIIPWIATASAVGTAIALMVATRELVPLTAALLALSVAFEIAAVLGRLFTVRLIAALAADFAVWLLAYILLSPAGLPEGYREPTPIVLIALSLALAIIYGASIGIRGFGSRQEISVFEIFQGIAAFVLASFGVLRATHDSALPELGIVFLLMAAGCYWGALYRFADESFVRNRRVSSNWAAALLLCGSYFLLPTALQAVFLCATSLTAAFVYKRTGKLSLGIHVSVYLAAAAAVSPFSKYISEALAGTVPEAPDSLSWIVGLSAALCYAIGAQHHEDRPRRRLLWLVPALLLGFAAASVAVVGVAKVAAGRVESGASSLSMIRTVANCGLALVLGVLCSRYKRMELGWAAYAAVGFGTIKLALEDLRFGNAASLVVSLLFYGLILILLPKLTRESPAVARTGLSESSRS